jgi:hypothetical protein
VSLSVVEVVAKAQPEQRRCCVFWRSGVTTVVVLTVGFLVALGLLLWTVHRLKPAKFHVKASITRWVSLDIQMQAPERGEDASSSPPANPSAHLRNTRP